MNIIGLENLSKKYKFGIGHIRTLLCRPEFNKYRTEKNFYFNDCEELHEDLKNIINIKRIGYAKWKYRKIVILLFALFFNIQSAICQHYEQIIIHNQYGEPQILLKGRIIYDYYGIPKINTKTKRSMSNICKEQGY